MAAAPVDAFASTAYVGVQPPELRMFGYLHPGHVLAIDTASGQRRLLGPGGGEMVVTPDNKTVYSRYESKLRALDTATSAVTELPVPVGTELPVRVGRLAVTPDGATLLVTAGNTVTPVSTATNRPEDPISVDGATALAITPDGRTAYALTADKTLTPIDLPTRTPGPPIALAHEGKAIAITPDGALAVIAQPGERPAGFVQVVDLASGTAEAPVPIADHGASDVAIAPDGRTAYVVGHYMDLLAGFNCCAGRLFPFSIPTRTVGPAVEDLAILSGIQQLALDTTRLYGVVGRVYRGHTAGYVFARDLPPQSLRTTLYDGFEDGGASPTGVALGPSPAASLTVTAAAAGATTSFDAAGSSNDGGSITSYAWDFGDGTTATTNEPTASHRYASPGTYTATLRTTNTGGCATRFVYTGRSTTCTGSSTASTTRTVTIVAPGVTATTTRASAVTTTAATLNGTVDETAGSVDWHFQFGTTARYGQHTPAVRGTGPASTRVTGLKPNTTYHYRLAAATIGGTPLAGYGADVTFKTAATGMLRLRSKTLKVRGKSVRVALRCQSNVACRGKLKLTTGTRTCATASVQLKANQRRHRTLTVRSTCRKKRSALLTSTVTTGQKPFAATVRLKR